MKEITITVDTDALLPLTHEQRRKSYRLLIGRMGRILVRGDCPVLLWRTGQQLSNTMPDWLRASIK